MSTSAGEMQLTRVSRSFKCFIVSNKHSVQLCISPHYTIYTIRVQMMPTCCHIPPRASRSIFYCPRWLAAIVSSASFFKKDIRPIRMLV